MRKVSSYIRNDQEQYILKNPDTKNLEYSSIFARLIAQEKGLQKVSRDKFSSEITKLQVERSVYQKGIPQEEKEFLSQSPADKVKLKTKSTRLKTKIDQIGKKIDIEAKRKFLQEYKDPYSLINDMEKRDDERTVIIEEKTHLSKSTKLLQDEKKALLEQKSYLIGEIKKLKPQNSNEQEEKQNIRKKFKKQKKPKNIALENLE